MQTIKPVLPTHCLSRQVLERVWERGDIYKANYEGWYCVDCEEYKDEGDMDAGGWVAALAGCCVVQCCGPAAWLLQRCLAGMPVDHNLSVQRRSVERTASWHSSP